MVWIEDSDQALLPERSAHTVAALPPSEDTLIASVASSQVLPPVVVGLSNSDSNDDGPKSLFQASGTRFPLAPVLS